MKVLEKGRVLHFLDPLSRDSIYSKGSKLFLTLQGKRREIDCGRKLPAFFEKSRLLTRLFRLNRMNAILLSPDRLLIIYDYRVFIYDVSRDQLTERARFARTRYVHSQSICIESSTVSIGEYGRIGNKKDVGLLFSPDLGDTWEYKPLFKRGSVKNILSIRYDQWANRYWVFTGDAPEHCKIITFNRQYSDPQVIGEGIDFRAISSHFSDSKVLWLTNNPFGPSRVMSYDRTTRIVSTGDTLPGPVWYLTRSLRKHYCCTAAEDSLEGASTHAYLLESVDFQNWSVTQTFEKDRLSKRFFLYGLLTFASRPTPGNSIYFNCDALSQYDDCIVELEVE